MRGFIRHRKNSTGFTLVELCVVIAVIAILTSLAVPAVSNWLPNYKLKSASRELQSAFQRTRLEAIKRNTDVVMSLNAGESFRDLDGDGIYDPGETYTDSNGNGVWEAGVFVSGGCVGSYYIFADNGSGGGVAGDGIRNGTEPVLVGVEDTATGEITPITISKDVCLISTAFAATTGFNSRGLPLSAGNLQLKNSNDARHRLVLSNAGNVRLEISHNDGTTWGAE